LSILDEDYEAADCGGEINFDIVNQPTERKIEIVPKAYPVLSINGLEVVRITIRI